MCKTAKNRNDKQSFHQLFFFYMLIIQLKQHGGIYQLILLFSRIKLAHQEKCAGVADDKAIKESALVCLGLACPTTWVRCRLQTKFFCYIPSS